MNEEDMSNFMQKLNNIINNINSSDFNEDNSSSNNSFNNNNFKNFSSGENYKNNNLNLDINTILKIKTIMDKYNSFNTSPETNLLLSLKPYLNESRKQKLEQYIQYLKLAKLFENLNFNNGDVDIK